MQAVISVTGKDSVGIIAKVSQKCYENNVNIIDISQSVLKDYFAMIMLVEIDGLKIAFTDFVDMMNTIGKENNLSIHTMHEDIFNSMHRI